MFDFHILDLLKHEMAGYHHDSFEVAVGEVYSAIIATGICGRIIVLAIDIKSIQ